MAKHQHQLEKMIKHHVLMSGLTNKLAYLAWARELRIFSRKDWDDFPYQRRYGPAKEE